MIRSCSRSNLDNHEPELDHLTLNLLKLQVAKIAIRFNPLFCPLTSLFEHRASQSIVNMISKNTYCRGGSAGHRKATAGLVQGNDVDSSCKSLRRSIPRRRSRPSSSMRNLFQTQPEIRSENIYFMDTRRTPARERGEDDQAHLPACLARGMTEVLAKPDSMRGGPDSLYATSLYFSPHSSCARWSADTQSTP